MGRGDEERLGLGVSGAAALPGPEELLKILNHF